MEIINKGPEEFLGRIEEERRPFLPAQREIVAYFFSQYLPRKGPVLEVGSGQGWLRELIRGVVPDNISQRLTHLDICEDFLRVHNLRYPGSRVVAASIERLPFPEETFSAVVGLSSCDGLPDLTGAMKEIARVVSEGGIFVYFQDLPPSIFPLIEELLKKSKEKVIFPLTEQGYLVGFQLIEKKEIEKNLDKFTNLGGRNLISLFVKDPFLAYETGFKKPEYYEGFNIVSQGLKRVGFKNSKEVYLIDLFEENLTRSLKEAGFDPQFTGKKTNSVYVEAEGIPPYLRRRGNCFENELGMLKISTENNIPPGKVKVSSTMLVVVAKKIG